MRVCKGIKERRYFMAYILLPMYPEGWPEDAALVRCLIIVIDLSSVSCQRVADFPFATSQQEILKWQWYTMSMMYRYIAEALEEAVIYLCSVVMRCFWGLLIIVHCFASF